MNLQTHLLSRIIVVALLCLSVTAGYLLYRSDRQARQSTQAAAESLGRQLEFQLLRIHTGLGQANPFPDFELWKQNAAAGVCIGYASADGAVTRNICNGSKLSGRDWPDGFERIYRRLFNPGAAITRPVAFNGRLYGSLTVTSGADPEIARAWENLQGLLGLSAVTALGVCLLTYLSVSRALRPARTIVDGLDRLEKGDLACRLPGFELNEWRRISAALNKLADSQQHLLEERHKLAVKLLTLQEEERRYLARELHDEIGQCLAAINAVALSIACAAERHCPEAVEEAQQIGRIVQHIMDSVRGLLKRLRPAELDELGLAACLNGLIGEWNAHCGGKTRYQLSIGGDCALLPKTAQVAVFRIVQEALTNIAKHAAAANAGIALNIGQDSTALTIKDDGIARQLPFPETAGIGLLGIRERVTALNGGLTLAIVPPHGLLVEVSLPIVPNGDI